MAIITWPAALRIKSVAWRLEQPAAVNTSEWTGERTVLRRTGAKWYAGIQLVPIRGEARVRPARAFLGALEGRANSFRLPACEGDQHAFGAVAAVVSGAGQTGSTLVASGLPAGVTFLPAGAFIEFGDELKVLTADCVTNGAGVGTFNFAPRIRVSPANGAPIATLRPTALLSLASDSVSLPVDAGQLYTIAFDAEEAF